MSNVLLVDPAESVNIKFLWADFIGTAGLVSVSHTVPSPLTKVAEDTDIPNKTSTVKISGALHGGHYQIQATAQLDSIETVNRSATVRCLDA